MNYTKGEWRFQNDFIVQGYLPNEDLIAEVNIDNPNYEFNAHLIAAAPDMYQLLKEIYEAELGADIVRILSPWFDKVEQALAKAEGK